MKFKAKTISNVQKLVHKRANGSDFIELKMLLAKSR